MDGQLYMWRVADVSLLGALLPQDTWLLRAVLAVGSMKTLFTCMMVSLFYSSPVASGGVSFETQIVSKFLLNGPSISMTHDAQNEICNTPFSARGSPPFGDSRPTSGKNKYIANDNLTE